MTFKNVGALVSDWGTEQNIKLYWCQRQIWGCQRLLPPAAATFRFLRGVRLNGRPPVFSKTVCIFAFPGPNLTWLGRFWKFKQNKAMMSSKYHQQQPDWPRAQAQQTSLRSRSASRHRGSGTVYWATLGGRRHVLPQPSNRQGGKGPAALGSTRAHDVSGSSICKSTHSGDNRTREPLFWQKKWGQAFMWCCTSTPCFRSWRVLRYVWNLRKRANINLFVGFLLTFQMYFPPPKTMYNISRNVLGS